MGADSDKWILSNYKKRVTELLIDSAVGINQEGSLGLGGYALYIEQLAEYMSTIWIKMGSSGEASENGQAEDVEVDHDGALTPAKSPKEAADCVEAQ